MAKSRGYYFRFPCPECGASQKVLPAQAGTEIRCSECPAVIVVPALNQLNALSSAPTNSKRQPTLNRAGDSKKEPERSAPPREVKVAQGHMVSFACPVCQTTMKASAEEMGHKIMCPTCFSPVTVGGEKAKKPAAPEPPSLVLEDAGDDDYRLTDEQPLIPQRPGPSSNHEVDDSDDEFRLSEVEERPRAPLPADLGAEEGNDAQEMRRPAPVARPRRDRVSTPAAPAAKTLQDDAGFADPWDVQERSDRPSLEERLLAAQPDRGSGEIPDHPFLSGIVNFLFEASTLPWWMGLALGVAFVYFLTANFIDALDGGGAQMFFAVICAAMSATGGLVLIMVASVMMLAVIQDTAVGNNRIETWPDYVFLDWAGQAFYVINAVAFSALPGFLVATAVLGADGAERWTAAAISLAVLFPIVLLSQLDGGSPFSILSGNVFKSMLSAPLAWLAFYTMAALVLAVTLGGIFLTLRVVAYSGVVAAVVVGVLGSTLLLLLSRLIGRLGMFCEESEVILPTATDEEENQDDTVVE